MVIARGMYKVGDLERQMHYKIQSGPYDWSQQSVGVDAVPRHVKDVHRSPEL